MSKTRVFIAVASYRRLCGAGLLLCGARRVRTRALRGAALSSTATATMSPASSVSVTCPAPMPSLRRTFSPRGEYTTSGRPQEFCTTPTSRIQMPCANPGAHRLDDGLLGGKTHRQKPLGSPCFAELLAFGRHQQPLDEAIAVLVVEPLHARGLEHVDADAEDHRRAPSIRAFMSRTARSRPIKIARATMQWPMLSSTISRDRCHRRHVVVGESMPGVHLEADIGGALRRGGQAFELARLGRTGRLGIRAGVQLDDRRSRAPGRLDLRQVRRDEQRHPDTRGAELAHRSRDALHVRRHVETPLGGDLGAVLGDQAAILRAHADGDVHHLVREPHLEIHARLQQRTQRVHVTVLDVAPILAQVQRDVVGARLLGEQRRMHGIRIRGTARLPHRRDVIDVDSQFNGGCMSRSSWIPSPLHRTRHGAGTKLTAFQTLIERLTQHAPRDIERLGVIQVFFLQRQQAAAGVCAGRVLAHLGKPFADAKPVERPRVDGELEAISQARQQALLEHAQAWARAPRRPPGGAALRRNPGRAASVDRGGWSGR